MMADNAELRQRFEAWITAEPYCKSVARLGEISSWPGQYVNYETQLAWESWQAAPAPPAAERERVEAKGSPQASQVTTTARTGTGRRGDER